MKQIYLFPFKNFYSHQYSAKKVANMAKYELKSPYLWMTLHSFHKGLLFLPRLFLDLRCVVAAVVGDTAGSLHLVHYLGRFIRDSLQGESVYKGINQCKGCSVTQTVLSVSLV